MTTKQLKFYQLLKQINNLDLMTETAALADTIKQAMTLDYYAAVEIWEFLILDNESKFEHDKQLAIIICDKIAQAFNEYSEARLIKTVIDNPAVCRAAFQLNPVCFTKPEIIAHVAALFVACKEDALTAVVGSCMKNTAGGVTFGEFMKAVVEKIFADSLSKSTNGKVVLSKKLTVILLDYIAKIKGSEKAVLTQRIKEVI